MKRGPLALLSFFTIALCLACYRFLDQPTALFFATVDYTTKHIFDLITSLGSSVPYLAVAAAGFVFFRFILKKKLPANVFLFLFVAIVVSGLVNDLIKLLVGRSRPGLFITQGTWGFKPLVRQYEYASFPSGHANTIAALCYGLNVVTGRFKYILPVIALTVMASRVVLEAHFLSDVLFGAYLGVVVTEVVAAGFERKGLQIRIGKH
jgi:membrane-associated phospholipid phosphatase